MQNTFYCSLTGKIKSRKKGNNLMQNGSLLSITTPLYFLHSNSFIRSIATPKSVNRQVKEFILKLLNFPAIIFTHFLSQWTVKLSLSPLTQKSTIRKPYKSQQTALVKLFYQRKWTSDRQPRKWPKPNSDRPGIVGR